MNKILEQEGFIGTVKGGNNGGAPRPFLIGPFIAGRLLF